MIKRTYLAKDENLEDALNFVNEQMECLDMSPKSAMMVDIALEEMFINVAHYAYPDKEGEITLEVDNSDNCIKVTLIDSGIPYNPLEKEDPDITLSAAERPIGGLGIFMVKKSTDETSYEYIDGQNRFTFVKRANQ